ncbi:hypothetical protein OG453_07190 [Streptomyces sp. NBC_01381]|uniref:hypothetical protein n=1 Tax=Streptomyces sp. NBC_01381 TaxID=2903845 RepID=UPI0022526815|nr:hypothetical protein [Streptomyces sp. NBC_01381]MCX4666452.1 hypothetical protein [Streptomyces sp. NBC_01381]
MDRPAEHQGMADGNELGSWPQCESIDYEVALELVNQVVAVYSSLFFYARTEEERELHRAEVAKYVQQREELDFVDRTELQRVVAEYAETLRRHKDG